MKHCRCYNISGLPNSFNGFFLKDEWYQYYTKIHKGTGMIVYYVIPDSKEDLVIDEFPCVEDRFLEHFDIVQVIREEKLNLILNNTKT